MVEQITSPQNPRIKLAHKLHDKRHREREGLFVVDSGRDLSRALGQGYQIAFALYCDALADADARTCLDNIPDHAIYHVPADLLAKASYRQNPTGIVAVLHQRALPAVMTLSPDVGIILCLVDLQKPGNIGALLRTADSAGIDAVILVDTSLDLYNPNILRSSTGACFSDKVYTANTAEALTHLRSNSYHIIGAHLEGATNIYEVDFRPRCAFVMGNEAQGLSHLWYDACDTRARIPMMGDIADSLNVSVAGAIFMYEALRQRRFDH